MGFEHFIDQGPADAAFAIKYLSPIDWDAEAVESAEGYMDMGGFSRDSLADQLEYEGFTAAQIAVALKAVGY